MSYLKILLMIFIVLKAIGQISWSWWLVFIPLYIELFLYIFIAVIEAWQDKHDPAWRIRERMKGR